MLSEKHNSRVDNIGFIAARTPLMPARTIVDILGAQNPISALRDRLQNDPLMRQCIIVASPVLGEAMNGWLSGRELRNRNTPLRLLAYVSRMCFRPTPLGLCAGIDLLSAGESTTARLDSRNRRSVTRPDMGLIGELAARLELGERRDDVCYVANEAIVERGGRLFITNVRVANNDASKSRQRSVTMRNTEAASFVRELARKPVAYGEIVSRLTNQFDASRSDAQKLVDSLIEAGLLLSELVLTPIGDPASAFHSRCKAIAPKLADDLSDALACAKELDGQPLHERSDEDYQRVLLNFSSLSESINTPVQIDMHAPVCGTLGDNVLRDVGRMSKYFVSMGAIMELRSYRERFLARYEGRERMVPLLELVDDNLGLGAPDGLEERKLSVPARDQFVMHIAQESLRNGISEITLDHGDLEKAIHPIDPESNPRAIEVGFQVVAPSPEAINGGNYFIVPTPYRGTMRAGRSLGRFMHLFREGDVNGIRSLLRELEDPDCLTAELVYPPFPARFYNVAIRPRLYDAEIQIGLKDTEAADPIALNDLWVGIDGDRFFLWSRSRGQRIRPVESHLLNSGRTAPNICRFLTCLDADGKRMMRGFDWGPASILPVLPRITCGRVVLSLRRWRLPVRDVGDSIKSATTGLERWRKMWSLPRYVHLLRGDNQLLLDLDSSVTPALVIDQIQKENQDCEFVEALPAPSDLWMRGTDGTHVAEFVCAIVFPKSSQVADSSNERWIELRRDRWGPGSDWIYAKLYVPSQTADEILLRHISPLIAEMRRTLDLDRWFFVRYQDEGGFHLRLRLHASADQAPILRDSFLRAAEDWFKHDRISRYVLDTYEPEYERYGGSENLHATEHFFTYDSDVCITLLDGLHYGADVRVAKAAESFLPWILEDGQLLDCAIRTFEKIGRQKLGKSDREALRKINRPERFGEPASGLPFVLTKNKSESLASLFHMHCNRLDVQGESEVRAVALLRAAVLAISRMPHEPPSVRSVPRSY